jgi:hypothetical protein
MSLTLYDAGHTFNTGVHAGTVQRIPQMIPVVAAGSDSEHVVALVRVSAYHICGMM